MANVIRDVKRYKSMIDGSVIEGRKQHREHLKRHGCIEVGDSVKFQPNGIPDIKPKERKEMIRQLVNQHTESTWRKMMRHEVQQRRDNPRKYYEGK